MARLSPPNPSRRLALAALTLAVAVGCASVSRRPRAPTVHTLADGTQVQCQMERPTGSHIPEEVCRKVDPAGLDVSRAQTQTNLAIPRGAPVPAGQ